MTKKIDAQELRQRLIAQFPKLAELMNDPMYEGKLRWQLGEAAVLTQTMIEENQREGYLKMISFMETGWSQGDVEVKKAIERGWLLRLEHEDWSLNALSSQLQAKNEELINEADAAESNVEGIKSGFSSVMVGIFYWLHVGILLVLMVAVMIGSVLYVDQIRQWVYGLPKDVVVLPYSQAGDWMQIVAMIGLIPWAGLLVLPLYLLIPKLWQREFDRKALSVTMARDEAGFEDILFEHAIEKRAKEIEQELTQNPVLYSRASKFYNWLWAIFLVPVAIAGPILYWGVLSNYFWWDEAGLHVREMWQTQEKVIAWNQPMQLIGAYEVTKSGFYPELKLVMSDGREVVMWDLNRNFNFEVAKVKGIIDSFNQHGVPITWQKLEVVFGKSDEKWLMYAQLANNWTREETLKWLSSTDPSTSPSEGAIFKNGHWVEKGSAEYVYDLGEKAYQAGQVDEAMTLFTQSLEIDSQFVPALAAQGLLLATERRQLDEGEAELKQALEIDPNWLQSYLYLAAVKSLKGEKAAVNELLKQARARFTQTEEVKLIEEMQNMLRANQK